MSTPRLHWTDCRPSAGMRRPRGSTPPDTAIYVIGDIHGRYDLLANIQQGIAIDAGMRRARRKVVIYLGDYLSRGKDSRRVIERVLAWRPDGCEIVALKGNHEDLALRYLGGELDAGRHWFDYDGLDALAHYGVAAADRAARDGESMEALRRRFADALPEEHLAFLRNLKASHHEGDYHFVHAGIRPGVALDAQSDHDQMWIRGRFLESDVDHGATVVHGHSITPEPEVRHNRIGIDTGAYTSGILTCLMLDGEERAFLQT
ncbi:MAG TPA: metallophosphoesterase [Burkholderiaceae bacterium]|nr:metallophosphoesterase [Burkholderiaceae bacterium]